MQRFLVTSGVLFTFICAAWLGRLILQVPVTVNGLSVPVWLSVIPIVITGSLAAWAFTLSRTSSKR